VGVLDDHDHGGAPGEPAQEGEQERVEAFPPTGREARIPAVQGLFAQAHDTRAHGDGLRVAAREFAQKQPEARPALGDRLLRGDPGDPLEMFDRRLERRK
jgi:hypothetical protein